MKGKFLFGALLMALLGAAIALVAYTKIVDRPDAVITKDSSKIETPEARAYLTALQMQQGQVDFTYAAEETVHAVVHVRTKTMSIYSGHSGFWMLLHNAAVNGA